MTDTITEPEIPDSDDVPEDEEDDLDEDEDEAADDEPHGHAHTAGYPAHRHRDDGVKYDYSQVHQAGGLELFPAERHDADSEQAEGLQADRGAGHLSNLIDAFTRLAGDLGWEADRIEHPSKPGGAIFGLTKDGTAVSAEIAHTE
jgi:hypothetical protein